MGKSRKYRLPDYAKASLKKLPWHNAEPIPEMNAYNGLVKDSFHRFKGIRGLTGPVYFYECKFAIDGDGSDPPVPGDTYQPRTSLRFTDGTSLSSLGYPFTVIPMVKPGHHLTSFRDLGIQLSDVGVVFWKDRSQGFAYADQGPDGPHWEHIGEGSRYVAQKLGINPDPVHGGIDVEQIPPGVIHICFPGTGDWKDPEDPRTSRSAIEVESLARQYLDYLLHP